METRIIITLNQEEYKRLPIDALVEYASNSMNTGTQRRKREAFFTKDELELLPKYIDRARKMYYDPHQTMEIQPNELLMWNRIGEFLYKNWCIH